MVPSCFSVSAVSFYISPHMPLFPISLVKDCSFMTFHIFKCHTYFLRLWNILLHFMPFLWVYFFKKDQRSFPFKS